MARSTSSRLTIAGAALAAAGLLVLPPAVAYAHTDDVFGSVYVYPGPTPSGTPDFGFLQEEKGTADYTLLPETTSIDEIYYPLGIEILDEQGYLVHFLPPEEEETLEEISSLAALSSWDHETGAVELGVRPALDESLFEEGGPYEDFDEGVIYMMKLLDSSDDRLLTVGFAYLGTDDEVTALGVHIFSVDPATGVAVPVASFEEDAAEWVLFASTGLATDPTTGITWLFLYNPEAEEGDSLNLVVPVELDGEIETFPVSVASDIEELSDAIDALVAGESDGLPELDAAVVELADFEEFPGPENLYSEGSLLTGTDFDDEGTLWFHTIVMGDEGPESFNLSSAPGPFSADAEVVDSGVLLDPASLEEEGLYPSVLGGGPFGYAGLIAVDDLIEDEELEETETLPDTGIDGLAPVGAAAVALLGGVLLLLGRRKRTA